MFISCEIRASHYKSINTAVSVCLKMFRRTLGQLLLLRVFKFRYSYASILCESVQMQTDTSRNS